MIIFPNVAHFLLIGDKFMLTILSLPIPDTLYLPTLSMQYSSYSTSFPMCQNLASFRMYPKRPFRKFNLNWERNTQIRRMRVWIKVLNSLVIFNQLIISRYRTVIF